MRESIDALRSFGEDKIYKDTHIPVRYIRAILEADFSKFTKLQLLGFIAILEREYELDMSKFKEEGLEYIKDIEKQEGKKEINEGLFVPPVKKVKLPSSYIVIVACIVFIGGYLLLEGIANEEKTFNAQELNDTESFSKQVALIQEINSSKKEEKNTTNTKQMFEPVSEKEKLEAVEEVVVPQEKKIATSFIIKPKMKVWFGYIDLSNYKRYQKTFTDAMDLDPSKEWLLTFGHGYVDIIVDGEVKKFTSRKGLKFHYKDGQVTQITSEEFKRLNRGRKW
jgi:Na+-transporting methylmalonyl-CoA/oxaloacetate decarboxylase gamma subunit